VRSTPQPWVGMTVDQSPVRAAQICIALAGLVPIGMPTQGFGRFASSTLGFAAPSLRDSRAMDSLDMHNRQADFEFRKANLDRSDVLPALPFSPSPSQTAWSHITFPAFGFILDSGLRGYTGFETSNGAAS
jgi:hypothetical protein